MSICSYKNCKNKFYASSGIKFKFFRFPTDPEMSSQWLELCGRPDLKSKDSRELNERHRLCSEHFEDEMYINAEKTRLLNLAIPKKYTETFSIPVSDLEEASTSSGIQKSSSETPVFSKNIKIISDITMAQTMPGVRCSVLGCGRSKIKENKKGESTSFHNFPKAKDFASTERRNKWISFCRRSDKYNPDTSQICSKHFKEQDFERDKQNELLGLPLRIRLKKSAVPTLRLPGGTESNLPESLPASQIIFVVPQKKMLDHEDLTPASDAMKESVFYQVVKNQINTKTIKPQLVSKTQYDALQVKLNALERDYANHKKLTRRKIKLLSDNLIYFKTKCSKMLLNKRKRVNWTLDEISVAITLRYYNQQCNAYLKRKINNPLPGLSYLKRWASRINVSQGIMLDVFPFLSLAGESLSPLQKSVVLLFDEIKVKSLLEYDVVRDEVIGPYNQMQVCMARGLFANWQQPVYAAFNQRITKEILLDVIQELYKIEYNVVACVCDCSERSMDLWKGLTIDSKKTFFPHPVTGKNVYMFADALHLLKLIRDCLLDKGFVIGDKIITKSPLVSLIDLTDTEINVCEKLSKKHTTCETSQRQNVHLAAQLFSATVGQALIKYKPGTDPEQAQNLGEFICDINNWFDVFNSYLKFSSSPFKCGFGVSFKQQEAHLVKMTNLMSQMRAVGKNILQGFQKGMIVSMESLKLLFRDMKSEFAVEHVCTHKLNLYSFQNFFFQIKSGGLDEHPTPLEAIKRMRLIILGKNSGILDSKVNTTDQAHEEYIVTYVLKQANIDTPDCQTAFKDDPSICCNSYTSLPVDSVNISAEETSYNTLEYIAGYLAKKFKDKQPNLGDPTKLIEREYSLPLWVQQLFYGDLIQSSTNLIEGDHSYSLPPWVQHHGGFIKPSEEWLKKTIEWDNYFQHYHGEVFKKGSMVNKLLAAKIKKTEDLPFDIIMSFCKLRLIIRLNYINIRNFELRNLKRKLHSPTELEIQIQKKFKSIVKTYLSQ